MPKKKMSTVKVPLEDEESEEEIDFVFLPFGLSGFQDFIEEDLGLKLEGNEEGDIEVAEEELRDNPFEHINEAVDKIFERCISHKIVDRERGIAINEDTLENSKKVGYGEEKELAEKALEDEPYDIRDFMIDEQTEIFEALIEDTVGSVEEGKKKAENFLGD